MAETRRYETIFFFLPWRARDETLLAIKFRIGADMILFWLFNELLESFWGWLPAKGFEVRHRERSVQDNHIQRAGHIFSTCLTTSSTSDVLEIRQQSTNVKFRGLIASNSSVLEEPLTRAKQKVWAFQDFLWPNPNYPLEVPVTKYEVIGENWVNAPSILWGLLSGAYCGTHFCSNRSWYITRTADCRSDSHPKSWFTPEHRGFMRENGDSH